MFSSVTTPKSKNGKLVLKKKQQHALQYDHNSSKQDREPFKTEENLVNILETLLVPTNNSFNLGYLKEFDCANGIADIALFEFKKNWVTNSAIGNLTPRWAFALHQLPYRKIFVVSDFAKAAGVTEKRALIALRQYELFGFCRKNNKGLWVKTKQPGTIVNKIYAIEAKLHDWKRALSQAYRYLEYAHQAWVILDHSRSRPAIENIQKFKRLNIGLASLMSNRTIIVHYNSKTLPPKLPHKFWQANSKIASKLITSNS